MDTSRAIIRPPRYPVLKTFAVRDRVWVHVLGTVTHQQIYVHGSGLRLGFGDSTVKVLQGWWGQPVTGSVEIVVASWCRIQS
jgi:hypothetical protein